MPGKPSKRGANGNISADVAEELVAKLMECSSLANMIGLSFDDRPLGNAAPADVEAIQASQKAWDALFADIQAIASRVGRIPLPR